MYNCIIIWMRVSLAEFKILILEKKQWLKKIMYDQQKVNREIFSIKYKTRKHTMLTVLVIINTLKFLQVFNFVDFIIC